MTEKTRDPLVTVKDLHVEFDVRDGIVHSVDGASLTSTAGKRLGSSVKVVVENRLPPKRS